MKQGIKKSTPEQIEEMRRLYQAGLSLMEIGRRMSRDSSTILYWMRKKGDYLPNRKLLPKKKSKKVLKSCQQNLLREEDLKLCLICKKEKKDPKWQKTNYCSLNCWSQVMATKKEANKNWYW